MISTDMYVRITDAMDKIIKKYFNEKYSMDDVRTINFNSFRLRLLNGLFDVLTKHGIIMTIHPKQKVVISTGMYGLVRCNLTEANFCSTPVEWLTCMDDQHDFTYDFSYFKKNIGCCEEHEDLSGCSDTDDIESIKFQYSLISENEEEYGFSSMLSSGLYVLPFNEVAYKRSSHLGSTAKEFELILEELGG